MIEADFDTFMTNSFEVVGHQKKHWGDLWLYHSECLVVAKHAIGQDHRRTSVT
jgi:hypothetical protein